MGTKEIIIVAPATQPGEALSQPLEQSGWRATFCDTTASAVTRLLARNGDALVVSLSTQRLQELASVYRAREVKSRSDLPIIATCAPHETESLKSYLQAVDITAWLPEPYGPQTLLDVLPTNSATEQLTVEALHKIQAKLVKQNFFERLNVQSDADIPTLRRGYNLRLKEYTESPCEGDPDTVRRVRRKITETLNEALAALRNPNRRASYLVSISKAQTAEPTQEISDARREPSVSPPAPTLTVPTQDESQTDTVQSQPALKTNQSTPKPDSDLLSELRHTTRDATSDSDAESDFDSILSSIIGRHEQRNDPPISPVRTTQLENLFDAAIGAVAHKPVATPPAENDEVSTMSVTAAAHTAKPQVKPPEPSQSHRSLDTVKGADAETPANPQLADVQPEAAAITGAAKGEQGTPNTAPPVLGDESSPIGATDEPSHSDEPLAQMQTPAQPQSNSDGEDGDSEDLPDFGDLGGIFDMDEEDAQAIVDAALAGHEPEPLPSDEDSKATVMVDGGETPEPKEEGPSVPLSAAQLAAQAMTNSKQPTRDASVETIDDSAVAESVSFERSDPATALAPDSRVLDYSARMHAAMGNFEKAKLLTNQARKQTPSRRLDYRLGLVQAQEALASEQTDTAKALLQQLIEAHDNHEEASVLLQSLTTKRTGLLRLFGREE